MGFDIWFSPWTYVLLEVLAFAFSINATPSLCMFIEHIYCAKNKFIEQTCGIGDGVKWDLVKTYYIFNSIDQLTAALIKLCKIFLSQGS